MTGARRPFALVHAALLLATAGCGEREAVTLHQGATPRRITTSPGLELDAAFSPDGTEIAYCSARTGRFEIYLRRLDDGVERPLTSDGRQNFQPAFSPDGKTVVYHAKERGIWLVPVSGGAPRALTNFGSRPKVSPDGRLVVLQSEEFNAIAATATSPPSTIWVAPMAGGPARSITKEGDPVGGHGSPFFTPDGRRIGFISHAAGQGHVALYTIGLDRKDLRRLLTAPRLYEPVLAPDGATLYFGGLRDDLHAVMAATLSPKTGELLGEPRPLTIPAVEVPRQLALSPDGRRLAWTALSSRAGIYSLALAADGSPISTPRPLTSSGTNGASGFPRVPSGLRDSRPVFSPDGRRIAFDRRREGENENVWVMDADGSHPVKVTSGTESTYSRDWFPDGRRLFVIAMRPGRQTMEARVVDVERRTTAPLPLPFQDLGPARLSPDGLRVVFHSQRTGRTLNLWSVGFDGRPPVQLTFDLEQASYPVFSRDGRWLAFDVKRGDDVHVAVMPSGGGTPEQLTSAKSLSWPTSFSPDGDKVLFAGLREDGWNVYWVSRDTRSVRKLTSFDVLDSYVRYPAWSPTGEQIVFERGETDGSLWMLEASRQ